MKGERHVVASGDGATVGSGHRSEPDVAPATRAGGLLAVEMDRVLERARAGDAAAVEHLYRAFADSILAYLCTQVRRREDAEDLVGQVFLEAVRDVSRFSGNASGFRAWLFRIAYNRAVDLGRRQTRRTEEPLETVEKHAALDDPEMEAIDRLERSRLREAVLALPPDQRNVISLRLAGALSSAEIAGVLGKTTGAVKALQHRALSNLARLLAETPPGEEPGGASPAEQAAYPRGPVRRSSPWSRQSGRKGRQR